MRKVKSKLREITLGEESEMLRFFKEIYYAFKLQCFSLAYKIDLKLSEILYDSLKLGIKSIEREEEEFYGLRIANINGIGFELWDHGEYYSWLCRGRIFKNRQVIYQWDEKCISREYMFKIRELINHENNAYDNLRGEICEKISNGY